MAWLDMPREMEAALDRMQDTPARQRLGRIHDVQIKTLVRHVDERGFFIEQLKRGDLDDDGRPFIGDALFAQMSRTLAYARGGNPPELIKAFHWHRRQWDYWDVVGGHARVVLVDLRLDSPTSGKIQTLAVGDHNPQMIAIPPFVAHGYQCLGMKDVEMVYYVTEPYEPNNPDEGRIPWDDPRIGFDWRVDNI
jgi:dTDP-4-dehydrorhamnose 3,5-epimerase